MALVLPHPWQRVIVSCPTIHASRTWGACKHNQPYAQDKLQQQHLAMVHACGPMEGLASRSQRLQCMAGTVQLGLHLPSGAAMAVAVPKCSYTCPDFQQVQAQPMPQP